jgi:hypothetical protein
MFHGFHDSTLTIIVNSKEKKKIGIVPAKLAPQIWHVGEKRLYKASSYTIVRYIKEQLIEDKNAG